MEPLTLIALVAAAGFLFRRTAERYTAPREEHRPSRDIVARPRASAVAATAISIEEIEVLPEYLLVRDLIRNQFPLTFVTGGAGTGKSTFVRWLLQEFEGSALLAAPTAVAAVNIEGKTLHSLCQLPPAWIVRKDIKALSRRIELTQAKLLIIDEISMVTANLLDGVSAFFRLNRKVDKPFGGLPVLMIGDMFQLPPVVTGDVKKLFERFYGSARFYNAKCLNGTPYYGVELKKTFRQVDQSFVDVLAKLREGVEVEESLDWLNGSCRIIQNPPIGAVWLSPRNAEVDCRNRQELEKIQSVTKSYRGKIVGKFKADRLPSPFDLDLKVGAQVMFTKNDPMRRWINGTIGRVEELGEDIVSVRLSASNESVDVGRMKWPEFEYRWNEEAEEIEREEIGAYIQLPLVAAWAITIHKSQGRTIERVHVDLGRGAFETGQTYVALSRCRSIEGLSMSRPLTSADIIVDKESRLYYTELRELIRRLPPDKIMESLAGNLPNSGTGVDLVR